jgi:hypothetical protein
VENLNVWFISAANSSQFITLKFHAMSTECSYDYVFVYDGDSFESPLIGSFSGKTQPQQVTATSGAVSYELDLYWFFNNMRYADL